MDLLCCCTFPEAIHTYVGEILGMFYHPIQLHTYLTLPYLAPAESPGEEPAERWVKRVG